MNHIKQDKHENETFLFTSESVGEGHPGAFSFYLAWTFYKIAYNIFNLNCR